MPRRLPWLVKTEPKPENGDADITSATRASRDTNETSTLKRVQNESTTNDGPPDAQPSTKKSRKTTQYMDEPPEEAFMIEGYDADDGWRMVEDEFFLTARLFTAHLHAAEYRRLKKIAEESGTDQFFQPADDIVVDTALRARDNGSRSKGKGKQPAVEQDAVDAMEADPFMQDTTLAAMMTNNRSQSSSQHLITRLPAAGAPPAESLVAEPSGWVGVGASASVVKDIDMDLDEVPHSTSIHDNLSGGKDASARESARKPSVQSDMWIGPGRSASALPMPPPAQGQNRSANERQTSTSSQLSESRSHLSIGSSQRPKSALVHPAPHTSSTIPDTPKAAVDAFKNQDVMDFKRTALNPRVMARLAKRKQQPKAAGDEATEANASKEPENVIPTFAY